MREETKHILLQQMLPLSEAECGLRQYLIDHPDKQFMVYEELRALIRQYIGYDIQSERPLSEDSLIPDGFNVWTLKHLRYLPGCLHSHDFFEINCVLSGECSYQTLDRYVPIRAGDVVIFPPHKTHSIYAGSDDCILINVLIRSSTFDQYFFSIFDQFDVLTDFWMRALHGTQECGYLLCHCGEDEEISNCVLGMYQVSRTDQKYQSQMLDALLHLFLITLLQWHEQDMILSNPERRQDDGKLLRVLHYMSQEYQTLTLEKLAETFHYSERQMSRVLKEYTGLNFGQLIRDFRLKKAISLVENSTLSMEAIAEAVGYTDASHFYRAFKKQYHCTPIEYRTSCHAG